MTLPSTPVVDMFGRLFGTILATLLEKCPSGAALSREGIADTLTRVGSSFDELVGETLSPGSGCLRPTDPALSELRAELATLRNHVSKLMDGGQDQLLRDQGAGRFDGVPLGSGSLDRGLISRLTKRYSGNPHDTKHIRVKGTRHDLTVECYYPKNAADIQTDTLFHSQNEPNQWLYYDFRKMRVTAAHYFLRSHCYPVDSYHLRSWVIEASGDKINWTEIDRRENGNCLNGPSHSCVFAIPSVIETRLIRLRSIGPDCAGTNWLIICAFELFGGLRLLDSAEQL